MRKSIRTGVLALAAGASTLLAQGQPAKGPAPKSQAELTALQALFQAQQTGADAVIKAAEELLTKFADTDFKDTALLLEAQAYRAKNDDAKAQIYAERLLEASPKNFQALLMVGEILVKGTREHDLDRDEKLTKANKYFNDGIANVKATAKPNPQLSDEQWAEIQKQIQAEAHNGIGMGELVRKKNDVAIAEFKAAIDLDPKEYTYQVRLASALQVAGKNDEAKAVAEKVISAPDVIPQVKQAAESIKAAATKK